MLVAQERVLFLTALVICNVKGNSPTEGDVEWPSLGGLTPGLDFRPPPPRHPPKPHSTSSPISAASSTSTTPTIDTTVSETEKSNINTRRCTFGSAASSTYSSSMTEAERVYIDTSSSAQCSGIIRWWNVCLWSMLERNSGSVTLLVVQSGDNGTYNIVNERKYDVEITAHNYNQPVCVQFKTEEDIFVEEGDYLGFICSESMHVTLATRSLNKTNASLKVYRSQYYPLDSSIRNTSQLSTIHLSADNLEDVRHNGSTVVSLLQVILGKLSYCL